MKKRIIEEERHGDDAIRATGSLLYVNTMLKGVILVLMVALVSVSVFMISLLGKVAEVKPLPIFVDREAGTARSVDFSAIDASGEKRDEAEIHDFCKNYIYDLYTYNQYTIQSNLKRIFALTVRDAHAMLKAAILQSGRTETGQNGNPGLCEIQSVTIIESNVSDIRVQVVFTEKVMDGYGEEKRNRKAIAIIRMKTVLRQRDNAHGFFVIEYRESEIKEG